MKAFDFKIGDLLVSHLGTPILIHAISTNMSGNKAIYLMFQRKKDITDCLPYAIVDYNLELEIISGKFIYYPIIT